MSAHIEANGPTSSGAVPVLATKPDDSPEACAERARKAINAALDALPDRGDDESTIAYCYRKREAIKRNMPRGLPDEELDEWIDTHDGLEEAIGRFSAKTFRDLGIKLTILCDRLRENSSTCHGEICDLMIAQCAHDDLRRLGGAPEVAAMTINDPAVADDKRLLDLGHQRLEVIAQRRKLAAIDVEHPDDGRLFDLCRKLEKEIAEAPARTVAGVAVKIRLLHDNHERGLDSLTYDAACIRTALEALERLTGGAA